MRPLTSAGCLDLWERGRTLHSLDRGLLALSFASPEAAAGDIPDWPLGRRNQALLNLYGQYFGTRLEAWTSCAGCGEDIELEVSALDLLAASNDRESGTQYGEPNGVSTNLDRIEMGSHSFRLPTSRDLAHVAVNAAAESSPGRAAMLLVERCRISSDDHLSLSAQDLEQIEASMAAADPLAEIRLAIHCPNCERSWSEPMDVARFLWNEIESRGRRLLREVHILAMNYGWTETEVLALSDGRRGLYVDLAQGLEE